PGGSKTATVIRRKGGEIVMKNGRPLTAMRDAGGEKTKNWRAVVAHEGRIAYQGTPLDEPLRVEFVFFMPRPQSHYGKKGLHKWAPIYSTTKPDTTKLIRAAEDALTGILWRDDTLIVEQTARKVYSDRPGMRITVSATSADKLGVIMSAGELVDLYDQGRSLTGATGT